MSDVKPSRWLFHGGSVHSDATIDVDFHPSDGGTFCFSIDNPKAGPIVCTLSNDDTHDLWVRLGRALDKGGA